MIYPRKNLIAYGLVAFYIIYENFYLFNFWSQLMFLEQMPNFLSILLILPAIYLLFVNKKYKETFILVFLAMLFPLPKFVSTALPFLVFSFFYNLRNKRNVFVHKSAIFVFFVLIVVTFWQLTIFYVDKNQDRKSTRLNSSH